MNGDTTTISESERQDHLTWLRELTQVPTAAGKEQRVIKWLERWFAAHPSLQVTRDSAGNLHAAMTNEPAGRPVYFTAHLDHPAFVVERIVAPEILELSFRGGVLDPYFVEAGVVVYDAHDQPHPATLFGPPDAHSAPGPFKHYMAELRHPTDTVAVGDVATWDVGHSEIIEGNLHAPACDDLAGLAAALAAFDVLIRPGVPPHPVRLLCTRAEEIGFIGAIGACREGTMDRQARVIALENSRSFAESPIGGGPIVRVGDRMSIFSPGLTDAIAKRAEDVAAANSGWKWQRKLMAGGACEASVYCTAGYEATCVCLPLGNYHNMADLDAVQAKTNIAPAKVAREFISVSDYEGLVDLLVACGRKLPPAVTVGDKFEKLWNERSFVLG